MSEPVISFYYQLAQGKQSLNSDKCVLLQAYNLIPRGKYMNTLEIISIWASINYSSLVLLSGLDTAYIVLSLHWELLQEL